MKIKNQVPILIADDDLDDCQMIREGFEENRLLNKLNFVHDGEELLDYLHHRGEYKGRAQYPQPGLILLDLNMPKKDGREVLKEIKSDPKLRQIPVVVFTTSQAEEDIYRTYNLGVNSYITKPVEFRSFMEVFRDIGKYWFEIVELPDDGNRK